MRLENASYPYPVVGYRDDAAGELTAGTLSVDVLGDVTQLALPELSCTNDVIRDLIKTKQAAFAIRIGCGSTLFRQVWTTRDPLFTVSLDSGQLHGRVEVRLEVIAKERLTDYRPSGAHADYQAVTFTLEPGAVLALGPKFWFEMDDNFDPLSGPASSLMRIRGSEVEDAPPNFIFQTDLITIELSKTDLALYGSLVQSASPVIHAALVLPALSEAIRLTRDTTEAAAEVASTRWCERLKLLVEAVDSGAQQSHLELANTLLKNPFRRAAIAVRALTTTGED